MPTIRLIVRYDGTELSGWQRQRELPTVQSHLESAVEQMTSSPARVHGAGRTDAGVHALAQVASFETTANIPPKGWTHGLTSKLPPSISIHEAREVPAGYDPRRVSGGKRYRYLIYQSRLRDPFLHNRAWLIHEALNLQLLEQCAQEFVGWHDFQAFRAADCERTSTARCVFCIRVLRDYHGVKDLLAIEVEGTAFLKNMVRIIVGTLVDIARERLPSDQVQQLFLAKDRKKAGITAPAHGLYLDEVFVRAEYLLADDTLRLRPDYAEPILHAIPEHLKQQIQNTSVVQSADEPESE